MFVYLFSLLLATSAWPGVWKITAEKMQGGTATYYLVIQDEESAQLYDHQWYPQVVRSFELTETTVKMGMNFEGVVMPTVLEGQLNGDQLKGMITFNFPQYEVKSEFSAERAIATPIPLPGDSIPGIIEGRTVNIVEYLSDNAPTEKFDVFLKFWREDVSPRYFVLIEPLLPRAEKDLEKDLKSVYESIDKLEKRAGEALLSASELDTDYVVLVPASERREPLTVEIASERKKWPPGYSPCCGDRLFNIKTFTLITVTP
jgi:hypothetical protein